MTVQTLKLAGRKFVIMSEKDYRALRRRGVKPTKRTRQNEVDRADLAIAMKRLNDPDEKAIPYQQVRKELGLV